MSEEAMSDQEQNNRGQWVPAIPLPLFGLRKACSCGRKFWTLDGYRGHYALEHIMHPSDGDSRSLQVELEDYRRFLWCVARQQGGRLTVSRAELAGCPPLPGWSSWNDSTGLHVQAHEDTHQGITAPAPRPR